MGARLYASPPLLAMHWPAVDNGRTACWTVEAIGPRSACPATAVSAIEVGRAHQTALVIGWRSSLAAGPPRRRAERRCRSSLSACGWSPRVAFCVLPCLSPVGVRLSFVASGRGERAPRVQHGRRGLVEGAGRASGRARPRSWHPRARRWHGRRALARGGRPSMADRRGFLRACPYVAGCGSSTTCAARALHGSAARARSPGATVAACAARRTMHVATQRCVPLSVLLSWSVRVCTRSARAVHESRFF
jgi:hypothetical protein